MRKYTDKEKEGLYLWCLAMLIDDLRDILNAYPVRKPLSEHTKQEFTLANADIALGVVEGQLEEMGIDIEKLVLEARKNHVHHESYEIPDFVRKE